MLVKGAPSLLFFTWNISRITIGLPTLNWFNWSMSQIIFIYNSSISKLTWHPPAQSVCGHLVSEARNQLPDLTSAGRFLSFPPPGLCKREFWLSFLNLGFMWIVLSLSLFLQLAFTRDYKNGLRFIIKFLFGRVWRDTWLWCQKQVSRVGISNYILQFTVGCIVIYTCLEYLLLVPRSSYNTLWNKNCHIRIQDIKYILPELYMF